MRGHLTRRQDIVERARREHRLSAKQIFERAYFWRWPNRRFDRRIVSYAYSAYRRARRICDWVRAFIAEGINAQPAAA